MGMMMELSDEVLDGRWDSRFRHKDSASNRLLAERIATLEADKGRLENEIENGWRDECARLKDDLAEARDLISTYSDMDCKGVAFGEQVLATMQDNTKLRESNRGMREALELIATKEIWRGDPQAQAAIIAQEALAKYGGQADGG
jgi:regulator of protease activity HflC (stomatin/prohibitin superfamily)